MDELEGQWGSSTGSLVFQIPRSPARQAKWSDPTGLMTEASRASDEMVAQGGGRKRHAGARRLWLGIGDPRREHCQSLTRLAGAVARAL